MTSFVLCRRWYDIHQETTYLSGTVCYIKVRKLNGKPITNLEVVWKALNGKIMKTLNSRNVRCENEPTIQRSQNSAHPIALAANAAKSEIIVHDFKWEMQTERTITTSNN